MQASDVPVAKLRNHVLDEAQGVQSIATRRTQLHVVDHRAVVHRHVDRNVRSVDEAGNLEAHGVHALDALLLLALDQEQDGGVAVVAVQDGEGAITVFTDSEGAIGCVSFLQAFHLGTLPGFGDDSYLQAS